MPNRILKESVSTSVNLNRLSLGAEVMFYRLITQADDYGRFDARPPVIRGRCFPLKRDIDDNKVAEWLEELCACSIVRCYEVSLVQYGEFISWESHQRIRNKRSKFPDPNDKLPRVAASSGLNPIQSESNPNPIMPSTSDAGHQQSSTKLSTEFEAWWCGGDGEPPYPRRVNKKKSHEKYVSARKNGATKEELAVGKRHYVQECQMLATEEHYIAYASTWLHQERWKDYQQPPKPVERKQNGIQSGDEQTAEQVAMYHSLMSRARSCATEIGLERQRDVLSEEDKQKIAALDQERVRHLEAAEEVKRKLKERGVDVEERRR